MTPSESSEGSPAKRRVAATLAAVAIVAVYLWVVFGPAPHDTSTDMWPRPLEPFGAVRVAELRFVWADPMDGAPVRVDVFDPGMTLLWRSAATTEGSLRPEDEVLSILPAGDAIWRPVAVPLNGPERIGDAAVVHLIRFGEAEGR